MKQVDRNYLRRYTLLITLMNHILMKAIAEIPTFEATRMKTHSKNKPIMNNNNSKPKIDHYSNSSFHSWPSWQYIWIRVFISLLNDFVSLFSLPIDTNLTDLYFSFVFVDCESFNSLYLWWIALKEFSRPIKRFISLNQKLFYW